MPHEMNMLGIFAYTGTGTGAEQTIPHTIGQTPDFVIASLQDKTGSDTITCKATAATGTNIYVTATNGKTYVLIAGIKGPA